MSEKLGIYICEGCRIGAAVDAAALSDKMGAELKPAFCKRHPALCSEAGQQLIREDIANSGLEGCLLAACGKGVKDEAFRFDPDISVERANIRELVAWTMEANVEDTVMAAGDYIRMGFKGLEQTSVVKPFVLDKNFSDILVVGGGVTGLNAALEGAENGYIVHLIEKTNRLGGWTISWKKQIPFNQPFNQLIEPVAGELVQRVLNNGNIKIHLECEIEKIDGQPGDFTVQLTRGEGNVFSVGAIVLASGWKPYKPAEEKDFYGLGRIPSVMTSIDFETLIASESKSIINSVLFVQCAGSRDEEHLSYCSSVCCGISLKQARYIRERYPEAVVYILYKDIRTTGFQEDFYKAMQDDPYIVFIKGSVDSLEKVSDGISISVNDLLLGEKLELKVDNVVLATGMVPNASEELKLGYRLGQGLPELKYDFSDSHFICFPYESRRTGIYPAGSVRAPMDIPSAMQDGAGAMMKAIQMVESVKRGDAVHPRAGDQTYPELYLDRCTDCKRCTEECPFGTYDETESGTPVVNPNRCRRCGICLGACPERVISFADFSITKISEMIKAVEVPDEFEEKPRVLVFVCENDAMPALEMAARKEEKINPYIRIIPVRCLGSINRVWVSDALSKGFDGILQIGCKPGDNYQCHFIHGSELTEQRSEIYEETLSSMMLEPERIRTTFVEITDYKKIVADIDEYMEEIDLIGPNPFKEM